MRTALPGPPPLPSLAAVRRAILDRQRGVDVFVSNHPGYDEAIEKLAEKPAAAANTFVMALTRRRGRLP